MKLPAPWLDHQVRALNDYQACGHVHPFTCGTPQKHAVGGVLGDTLYATREGWICPSCDYTQDWAWSFMFKGAPPRQT